MIARVVLLNLKVYIFFNLAQGIRGEKSNQRISGLKAPQNSIEKFSIFCDALLYEFCCVQQYTSLSSISVLWRRAY